jgi:hypothetical protein
MQIVFQVPAVISVKLRKHRTVDIKFVNCNTLNSSILSYSVCRHLINVLHYRNNVLQRLTVSLETSDSNVSRVFLPSVVMAVHVRIKSLHFAAANC